MKVVNFGWFASTKQEIVIITKHFFICKDSLFNRYHFIFEAFLAIEWDACQNNGKTQCSPICVEWTALVCYLYLELYLDFSHLDDLFRYLNRVLSIGPFSVIELYIIKIFFYEWIKFVPGETFHEVIKPATEKIFFHCLVISF